MGLSDERDFLRSLLELGEAADLPVLVDQALRLIMELTGSLHGYLKLESEGLVFETVSAMSSTDVQDVRQRLSSGIVRSAFRSGRTIITASARSDPRFESRRSVRVHQIAAALCSPIGCRDDSGPPLGTLYLEKRAEEGPYLPSDVANVELFARHLAPFADRLLLKRGEGGARDEALLASLYALDLIGQSPAFMSMIKQLAAVARTDATVLLTGQTGTGKTRLARLIHQNSSRRKGPFVQLNCAALPEALAEAELFGCKKGSHSTANADQLGRIPAANGGTIFLDEVGELSLAVQAKLLHVLEDGRYWVVGDCSPSQADVRVVAATNRDLVVAVANKQFREDLYHRLCLFELEVPCLAARSSDRLPLAQHFLRQAISKHRLSPLSLSRGALYYLENADIDGNLRGLRHLIERGAILASADGVYQVEVAHLNPRAKPTEVPVTWAEQMRDFQRRVLEEALKAESGNVSAVAKRLNLARSYVYRQLELHGLR